MAKRSNEYKREMVSRPIPRWDGEVAFRFPWSWVKANDERALGLRFICNRRLFGQAYRQLMADYFESMPEESGVMIRAFVPTSHIFPGVTFPGDIDLLIIPYEGDELVLSKVMAIELKAVRASFENQGKSPNQFGFTQAAGLLECGFPYVAVCHLVVSDESPRTHWDEIFTSRIGVGGRCEDLKREMADLMPSRLIDRAMGRLEKNSPNEKIGLSVVYQSPPDDLAEWFPRGKAATFNGRTSIGAMDAIYRYYRSHTRSFLETRSNPPPGLKEELPVEIGDISPDEISSDAILGVAVCVIRKPRKP